MKSRQTRVKTEGGFGAGEGFSGFQLPTYHQVGAQFVKLQNQI
jgi:hypothetical protein